MYNSTYETYVLNATKQTPFKSNPAYTGVLEHVTLTQGEMYLDRLRMECQMPTDTILGFCRQADSFGCPNTYLIRDLPIQVSPTSLRYLYHASLILQHAGPAVTSFVEVGCGYGGLFLALDYLAPSQIQSYHMVDLESVLPLLRSVVGADPRVSFHSATTFGANVPDGCFWISNYCFSELNEESRAMYRQTLLSRTPHGFLAWNFIPYSDTEIGHTATVVPETPMTGPGNAFVRF